jgi:hypothetical protein
MQESLDDIAYAVGDAFVSSNIGTAELILALVVALVFVASAVQTLIAGRPDEDHWHEHRF